MEEILNPYELAVKELTDKFNHLIREHKVKNLYSPIESVSGRVKSVTSILEKMQKKQIAIEQLEEQLEDIAGIRIICQFVEDIGRVAQIIRSRSDLTVKYEKDYIAHQKESGYRQFSHDHLLCGGNLKRPQTDPGGNPDPHHGYGFLGNHRAFPAVQI